MRIWSLHPKYLDTKGLVALWRETLLAKNVLENKTVGYKNHPQLIRFKKSNNPLQSINQYLSFIYDESIIRGYKFNRDKIDWNFERNTLTVTNGQMIYEVEHLKRKLVIRDPLSLKKLGEDCSPHPIFNIIEGNIESWEIIYP
jgi:hypothetical protein